MFRNSIFIFSLIISPLFVNSQVNMDFEVWGPSLTSDLEPTGWGTLNADAFIFCAPEYNGGSPPILTNAITWISLSTDNWRDGFNGKLAVIGTNSGGDGLRFLSSFRSQLEYMGTIVVPKTISVNNKKEFNIDSAERTLQSLIDLL